MRLRAPQLEKAIRDLARAELRSSPELLDTFNRRRRGWLVDRFATIAACSCGLGALVLVLSCAALFPQKSLPGEQNGAELLLVAVGLMGSGYCVFWGAGANRNDPGVLSGLASYVALHYPLRDGDLAVRATRHWVTGVFLFTVVGVWWVLESSLAFNQPVAWGHSMAAGLALLQGALVVGIYLWLICLPDEHPVRTALELLGFLAVMVGFVISWVAGYREDMPNFVTSVTFLTCPLGWAHGAFYWGAIRGQPAAYLLLVPAVATLFGLIFSIRRQNWIDDVLFDQDRLAEAAGRSAGRSSTRRGRTVADIAQEARGGMPVVQRSRRRRCCSTEAIERRLLGGQWLRDNDWVPWGPVDRFALVVLTPRERLLTECLHRRGSVLTWQSLLMLLLLVALGCAILFEPSGEDPPKIIPAVIVFCWGFTGLYLLEAMSGYHLLAPVGFFEVSRAMIKVGLIKCLCWLPLTVGFSLAVAARHDVPTLAAIGLGLLPVIVYLAWLPMGACFVFGPAIAETARWPARLFNAICLGLALTASLLFVAPMDVMSVVLAMPASIVRVVFGTVLFAATGSIWVCYAWILGGFRRRSTWHAGDRCLG